MNVSHKKVGLGLVALAVALMGSAALADKKGGHGMPGMGAMMDMPPVFDFAAADTDKDGKVSQAEFTAYRLAMVEGIDADKDGKLSAEEIVASRKADAPEGATKMITDMVAERDVDGDGKLSIGELISMPMPPDAFAMADTNKDGFIDQAEADAAMKMMEQGHGGKGGKDGKGHKGKGKGDQTTGQGGN